MFKLVKKFFSNIDEVLKAILLFTLIVSLIAIVICFIICLCTWFDDDVARLLLFILLGSNLGILFLYAFCDILTQLKLLNEKNK